jgi:hypothetical protein
MQRVIVCLATVEEAHVVEAPKCHLSLVTCPADSLEASCDDAIEAQPSAFLYFLREAARDLADTKGSVALLWVGHKKG